MSFKKNEVIKMVKDLVAKLRENITVNQAYLFGSYAQGHPGKWSDIDLALVSPQFKGVRFLDFKMLIPYLRGSSSFIEIHPFKKEDFNPRNLFIREIIKNGIKIS